MPPSGHRSKATEEIASIALDTFSCPIHQGWQRKLSELLPRTISPLGRTYMRIVEWPLFGVVGKANRKSHLLSNPLKVFIESAYPLAHSIELLPNASIVAVNIWTEEPSAFLEDKLPM